jgi:hypothetical protein
MAGAIAIRPEEGDALRVDWRNAIKRGQARAP